MAYIKMGLFRTREGFSIGGASSTANNSGFGTAQTDQATKESIDNAIREANVEKITEAQVNRAAANPPIDCEVYWGDWTPEPCNVGERQTQMYKVLREPANGGQPCPPQDTITRDCPASGTASGPSSSTASGPSSGPSSSTASGPSSSTETDTEPSTETDVDCVGSWGEFGECKDGKKTKTYTITTDASGEGTACEAEDGDTEPEDCSTPWYKNPLILGGIGIAVMMIIGLVIFVLMSKKRPDVPTTKTSV